jgi:hypothetical protein
VRASSSGGDGDIEARGGADRDQGGAESELDEAVNAPVSGGRDPTEWLPDELMLTVLERLPFTTLWGGACERVCLRWTRLMQSASIVRRKREGRWAAYETGTIMPRRLEGHTGTVFALAIGLEPRPCLLWIVRHNHHGLVGRERGASADVERAHHFRACACHRARRQHLLWFE